MKGSAVRVRASASKKPRQSRMFLGTDCRLGGQEGNRRGNNEPLESSRVPGGTGVGNSAATAGVGLALPQYAAQLTQFVVKRTRHPLVVRACVRASSDDTLRTS
jgi:hypothetical protein